QQAPSRGASISAQHSLRSAAVQTAPVNSQWIEGGRMVHSSQIESSVNATLSGEDKRFIRTQPSTPVVRLGGGRSGCVPGA
ncbi:MAG: hypothetical protein ACPHM1_09015, partial [Arenicellales bacterium]